MSDKTSQVEKKLLDIKLVKIFPSSLLSTRKNQLIDGEAKESPLHTTTLVLIAAATISTFSYRLTVITIRWQLAKIYRFVGSVVLSLTLIYGKRGLPTMWCWRTY
jgi:hypothetical protein